MMNAIISIKPQFVEQIAAGRKTYEYRKSVFKEEVDKVYIYATAPVSKIIGEFRPIDILKGKPMDIWKQTKEFSGVNEQFFKQYYKGRDIAYAIVIKNLHMYEKGVDLPNGMHAPQSFCYTVVDHFG